MIGWIVANTSSCGSRTYVSRLRHVMVRASATAWRRGMRHAVAAGGAVGETVGDRVVEVMPHLVSVGPPGGWWLRLHRACRRRGGPGAAGTRRRGCALA